MGRGLGYSGVHQSTDEQDNAEGSEPRRRLTFVSHAGEDKPFARSLQDAIEGANVASFFDEDMAVGTPAGDEMISSAATADQGVVVLSRPFLTKKWPMKELHLFVENGITIHPLYYRVNPDQLQLIVEIYDRHAGDDEPAFRRKMKETPGEWRTLMEKIGDSTRNEGSSSLPDPLCWREDVGELAKLTGLRREDFGEDEAGYLTAVAKMVSPPVLPSTMPPLPDHFVKLYLIDEVISELLDSAANTEMRGVVLTGMGGAGKSVLACAVALDKRIRRHFADGVLWLDQEPGSFSEQRFLLKLDKLAQQFEEVVLSRRYRQGRDSQYNVDEFQSVSDAQGFFQMWKKQFNLRCLLVVDDAWNVQVLQGVSAMGFQILATTRKEAAMPASLGWRSKAVPEMDEDNSLRVLQNCSGAPSAVPRESALEVARKCAFLPLALAIAGSTLRGAENTLSSDAWRKLHRNLKKKEDEGGERSALHNILAVSVDELGQTRRDLFFMLAVLGNGVLAMTEMLCHLWGEEDLEGARFLADGLVSRSLLQLRAQDQYFVHDVLLDFAKVSINESSPKVKDTATSRQSTFLGRIEVLAAYSGGERADAGLYALTTLWMSLKDLGGDSVSMVKEYTASLEDFERSGNRSESQVADTYCAVARVFEHQGNLADAESMYDRALRMADSARGEEDEHMGKWLNNLAVLKLKRGQHSEAAELFKRSQAIRKEVLGPEHTAVAESLVNQSVLMTTLNRHEAALELQSRALGILKNAYGETHPSVATTLLAKAEVLSHLGNYEDAKLLLFDAVAIGDKTLGPEHPTLATYLNALGSALLLQGEDLLLVHNSEQAQEKFKEAEPHFQRSLVVSKNALGPHHLKVAYNINNLAMLKKCQGKFEESLHLFEHATEIMVEALGSEHQAVGSALNNQAVVLVALGKYAQAEILCARSAWIFVKALGSEINHLVACPINNWAEALTRQGKYDMAILLFERALNIRIRSLGGGHQETAHTWNLLQQARMGLVQQPLQIQQPADPPGGPDRLGARSLAEAGSQGFAEGDLERAYDGYSSALEDGKYDPLSWGFRFRASVLINRASVLWVQGKFEASAADCSAALEVDPDRAEAYSRRALAREQLGQTDDALGDARAALMREPTNKEAAATTRRVGANVAEAARRNPPTPAGVDPSMDPELAYGLRLSMEENRARQEAPSEATAKQEGVAATDDRAAATGGKGGEVAAVAADAGVEETKARDSGDAEAAIGREVMQPVNAGDDEGLLQQALAMSLVDDDEVESLRIAIEMSMSRDTPAPVPAATAASTAATASPAQPPIPSPPSPSTATSANAIPVVAATAFPPGAGGGAAGELTGVDRAEGAGKKDEGDKSGILPPSI